MPDTLGHVIAGFSIVVENMGRALSRNFWGTPFFEKEILPYQHHGYLEVIKLQVFNTSDPLNTYSVESNM